MSAKAKKSDSLPYLLLRAKHTPEGPLTSDDCKALIGWTEEPQDEDWGKEFVLKDKFGRKIALLNNPSNRPFKLALAEQYAQEHLQGNWALNLETIVIDKQGNIPQGQHRLVGFILAEQTRRISPKLWGTKPLLFEVALGFGVSPKPETANTYDLGSGRKLGDVLYRHQEFAEEVTDKEQRKISRVLAGTIRLVWLRVGGKQVSFAPRLHPRAGIEFYGKHPAILDSVTEIVKLDQGEEGNKKLISSLVTLPYASALHYLMKSSPNADEGQALEFWESFASGVGLGKGSAILTLGKYLQTVSADSGSQRDKILGAIIKAWLLWVDGKQAKNVKDIRVKLTKNEDGKFTPAEFPRIGGLDAPVEASVDLTDHQRLILACLREAKEELTYKDLKLNTGLAQAALSKAIMPQSKSGQEQPHSLTSRGLVSVNQYEPEGKQKVAPLMFSLTAEGKKAV
jgi:hypothetical protein